MSSRFHSIQQSKTEKTVLLSLCSVLLIYFAPFFWQICSALVNPYTPYTASYEESQISTGHTLVQEKSSLSVNHNHQHSQFGFTLNAHQGVLNATSHINLFETCGYCSLLFYLNWIDVEPFELIALGKPTYPLLFISIFSTRLLPRFTPLNPRAPPQKTQSKY